MKKLLFLIILPLIFLTSHHAVAVEGCDIEIEGKSDSELERALEKCEEEIAEQQKELEKVQREAITIEGGIATLDYQIEISEDRISKTSLQISKLTNEIYNRNAHISELESTMNSIKETLSEILRSTFEIENVSIVEAVLSHDNLSEFFADADSYETLRRDLGVKIQELNFVQEETEKEKERLAAQREEERTAKFKQEAEKRNTELFKAEKERVLEVTRGEERLYKQLIAEKEAKRQAIRNKVFKLPSGSEITIGQAFDLIEPFEDRLGVSAALTLSILAQETGVGGVIGGNLGQCNYNEPWNNSSGTVMSASQIPSFLTIISEIGLNPDTTPVSCPINIDGPHGGAMGPSQFMPNTWMGYRGRVASTLRTDFASPFNNRDAFVGTMLYLQDALGRCQTAFTLESDLWKCAGAKYYSGLASKGDRLYRHMNGYGTSVYNRAVSLREDLDFLRL